MSDMSETLREEEGGDQVAEQECARDEADQVVRAHSRSTPFTSSSAATKNKAVSPRYSTSSMCVIRGRALDDTKELSELTQVEDGAST